MALGKEDGRLTRDVHGAELLPLPGRLGVGEVVEAPNPVADALLMVPHARPVDLAVQGGMPRRALLHELGEDAGFVRVLPPLGHVTEHPVPQLSGLSNTE